MESSSMWSRCVFNNKSYLLKMQKKKKVWCFLEVYVVVDVGINSLQLSDLSNNTVTVSVQIQIQSLKFMLCFCCQV